MSCGGKDLPEELLQEANAYSETQDPEILRVRQMYQQAYEKYKAQIKEESEKVRESWRPVYCRHGAP